MSGQKPKKAKSQRSPEDGSRDKTDRNREPASSTIDTADSTSDAATGLATSPALVRIREVPRPRLMVLLATTYAVWLALLFWLARSIS